MPNGVNSAVNAASTDMHKKTGTYRGGLSVFHGEEDFSDLSDLPYGAPSLGDTEVARRLRGRRCRWTGIKGWRGRWLKAIQSFFEHK
jgi:hypothetical protein